MWANHNWWNVPGDPDLGFLPLDDYQPWLWYYCSWIASKHKFKLTLKCLWVLRKLQSENVCSLKASWIAVCCSPAQFSIYPNTGGKPFTFLFPDNKRDSGYSLPFVVWNEISQCKCLRAIKWFANMLGFSQNESITLKQLSLKVKVINVAIMFYTGIPFNASISIFCT